MSRDGGGARGFLVHIRVMFSLSASEFGLIPVFSLVLLGCTPPAFTSSVGRLVVAIWTAAVLSLLLLLPIFPPMRHLISSFRRTARLAQLRRFPAGHGAPMVGATGGNEGSRRVLHK